MNKSPNIIFYIIGIFSCFIINFLPARTINFAGTTWYVKSGYGGPGPNYWSDSEQNVWLDANGWLHLKIRYSNGIWYCSEVYTTEFTQYGMHRFYIIGRLDSLDRNVVFAPFLYANDYAEIDIEFSTWGQSNPWFNAQYVVQPGQNPGNVDRFWISLNGDYSTHYINWWPDSIRFKSIHGHYQEPPNPNFLIHEWLYTGDDIPSQTENLRVHINLWLYQGQPPSNGQNVEAVIKDADLVNVIEAKKAHSLSFTLNQNFPNPVSRRTSIKYSIPNFCKVELKLFDVTGRQIAVLVNESQKPGCYQVTWDIHNVPEKRLPNGVYFYRLTAGDYTNTKKLVIVR
ncbi:MAG: T9SS type A sorting domain-containing protein [Candidatus Helarchaeota archaeon]